MNILRNKISAQLLIFPQNILTDIFFMTERMATDMMQKLFFVFPEETVGLFFLAGMVRVRYKNR